MTGYYTVVRFFVHITVSVYARNMRNKFRFSRPLHFNNSFLLNMLPEFLYVACIACILYNFVYFICILTHLKRNHKSRAWQFVRISRESREDRFAIFHGSPASDIRAVFEATDTRDSKFPTRRRPSLPA